MRPIYIVMTYYWDKKVKKNIFHVLEATTIKKH